MADFLKTKPSLICFDFDGTIADTMPFLEKIALTLIGQYYRLPKAEAKEKYRSTSGLPFEQQIKLIFPLHPPRLNSQVIKKFEKEKTNRINQQALFPKVKKVLHQLKKRGYRLALSSSTTKKIIRSYLENKGLARSFDTVMGYRLGFEKGQDHFHYLIRKYSLRPQEIVFIGDSLKDMERAYCFGTQFIGRTSHMFQVKDFKIRAVSDWIRFPTISSLEKVLSLL